MARAAAAALVALVCATAFGASAQALNPDGPGPETPNTSSRVWPTEVRSGDTLNFEVSGYPPNETVYIKIDDGLACSDTSHGACVYATQKLDGNGYASGSIVVPDLAPGAHWLRMLATGPIDPVTGERIEDGYAGYTRRGGNDFTVVAGGSGGGSSATAGGGAGAGASAGSGETVEGGSVSLDIDDDDLEKIEAAEKSGGSSMDDLTVNIEDESGEAVAAAPVAAEPPSGSQVPVVGLAVLGGALVLG
ncbi:MAG: hypothetical protein QM606_10665, partial [Leucobacter sp.]